MRCCRRTDLLAFGRPQQIARCDSTESEVSRSKPPPRDVVVAEYSGDRLRHAAGPHCELAFLHVEDAGDSRAKSLCADAVEVLCFFGAVPKHCRGDEHRWAGQALNHAGVRFDQLRFRLPAMPPIGGQPRAAPFPQLVEIDLGPGFDERGDSVANDRGRVRGLVRRPRRNCDRLRSPTRQWSSSAAGEVIGRSVMRRSIWDAAVHSQQDACGAYGSRGHFYGVFSGNSPRE